MLKKEILVGILVAAFSLGFAGVVFADHRGHSTIEQPSSSNVQQEKMTQEKGKPMPMNDRQREMKGSQPFVCDNSIATSTEQIKDKSSECKQLYNDLYRG